MRRGLLVALLVVWAGEGLAQQPAQRVLPRVTPPATRPHERAVCLPGVDHDLGLFTQPCKTFHAEGPTPDWLDRHVAATTRTARALFYRDLDQLERQHLQRFATPHQRTLGPVDKARFRQDRQVWEAYATAYVETSRAWEHMPGDRHRSSRPETVPMLAEKLAALKRTFFEVPAAPDLWDSRDSAVPVTAPWTGLLEAEEGDLIRVRVSRLRPALGYLWPDPVLWLMRLDGRGDPERGEVVALVDDEASEALELEHVALRAGVYRVIMAPYRAEAAGVAEVEATVDGVVQAHDPAAFFGGIPLVAGELSPGDLLLAGAAGLEGSFAHDAVLVTLPPPWELLDRTYAASNNDLGTLPLVRVEGRRRETLVLLCAFGDDSQPEVRLLLSRLSAHEDLDGDLLTAPLEARLGSCESAAAAAAGECDAPAPLPANWSPMDTDHDGFSDFEELYGLRRCYQRAPMPPYVETPGCLAAEDGRCLFFCPESTGYVAQLPLSALESPDPCAHDIYMEYDYWQGSGEPPGKHALPPDQVTLAKRAYEQAFVHRPGEPPEHWFAPLPYPMRFHFYQDDPLPLGLIERVAHIPALASRSLFFDLFFTPDRKYTGAFHYVVGNHKGGGQSDVLGRASIVGGSGGMSQSVKLIHETGHLVGLLHNGTQHNPDHTPFFLSVMSYGYAHTMPPPVAWDGSFRACSEANPCPDLFRCVDFAGYGPLCAPDCGIARQADGSKTHFARFSAGELELTAESSEAGTIPETGYPEWFLPYLYCYNPARKRVTHLQRLHRFTDPRCAQSHCVQCQGGTCSIDWNRDGRFEALEGFDLDGDGRLNERPLADTAGHRRMLEVGARGLRVMTKPTHAAYYSGFQGMEATNFLPYPSVVHERHGGYVTDVTNLCDEADKWPHCRDQARGEAALFRGAASGDRAIETKLPPGFCLDLSRGVTLSLRVKPLRIPPDEFPAVLFDSPALRVLLAGTPAEAQWVVEITEPGGARRRLELTDRGALGRWTRLTVMVSNERAEATVTARRGTLKLSRTTDKVRIDGPVCHFAIGGAPDADASFMGFLDDPMIIAGPVKTL